MGVIGKIIKVSLIGLCLYGVYQCNHMMTEARERKEGSELESKLENELQSNKVQNLDYKVVYGKDNINYGGIKNDTTTLCN